MNQGAKVKGGAEIITLYRAEFTAMKDTIARQKLEIAALEFRIKTLMSKGGK